MYRKTYSIKMIKTGNSWALTLRVSFTDFESDESGLSAEVLHRYLTMPQTVKVHMTD